MQEAVSRVVLMVVNDETLVSPGRQELFNKAAEGTDEKDAKK